MEVQGLRPAYMMSGEEALATLDALHAKIATLETYNLEVMARLDDTGYAKEIGAHDAARLIATRHRKNLGAVRRNLALAKALPKYPAVAAALPDPHAPAGSEPATQYADVVPDPAGAPADDSAGLTIEPNGPTVDAACEGQGDGGPSEPTELQVVLHPDQAQAIVAGLEAIPAAAQVAVEDLQVAEEQMVEAGRYLPPWELTRLGKQVRDLLDTDGPEPAEEAAARREAFWLKNADRGVKFGGYLSGENAALLKTLIEPAGKPVKTAEGEPDPRPREKRQADRFSDLLHLAAKTGELPSNGGEKPHLTITMDLADLIAAGKDATGDLRFGEGLSAGAVRRLGCDAEIIPIVLGAESEPLDVGRKKRLITPAMRKALNLRDKGCVVCGAAPIYCDAHHIKSWLDGGVTSIDNLALFCRAHHIDVDNGHYLVTITNGVVHVARPAWADPPPTARPPTTPWSPKTPSPNPADPPPRAADPGVDPRDPEPPNPKADDSPPPVADLGLDPWDPEPRDPKADDSPPPVADLGLDPWGSEARDPKAGDSPRPVADLGLDPWGPEPLEPTADDSPTCVTDLGLDPWGSESRDLKDGDPPPRLADLGLDPWGSESRDPEADDSPPPVADLGLDPWDREPLGPKIGDSHLCVADLGLDP